MQKADYSFITRLGDISGDGVAVYDLNSREFVYANRYFRDIFEVHRDATIGNGTILLKYLSEEDKAYIHERYVELLSIGCISATEFDLRVKGKVKHLSGDVLWLEENYAIALFIKDTTRAKENEEYLIKYTAQKDVILDMLIHNLSGPLALSKDVVDLIEKGHTTGAVDTGELLRILRQNTVECLNIVNGFLNKEFFESSATPAQKSRFDCVERIDEVLFMVRKMNQDKKIELISEPKSLIVNSDPIKFLQVVQNLLSNALKFTDVGGRITIHITGDEKTFTFVMEDDGIGIPEADQPFIFTEKIRGRKGLNDEASNGKGLFITHQLTAMMGGQISFTSRENQGTTFKVTLPREDM